MTPHKKLSSLAILLALFLSAGCATVKVSGHQYDNPIQKSIANEKVVNEPFSAVWDRSVAKLSSSFFVINNIDKQSRLINLSFSTDMAEKYVDCGQTTRDFSFQGETSSYTYEVAEDSFYKSISKWGAYKNLPAVAQVTRTTNLDGRINLYMAPVNSTKTKVAANVRYILSMHTSGFYDGYNAFGTVQVRQPISPISAPPISFNTKKPTSKNLGYAQGTQRVTCQSNGLLESELLGMATK